MIGMWCGESHDTETTRFLAEPDCGCLCTSTPYLEIGMHVYVSIGISPMAKLAKLHNLSCKKLLKEYRKPVGCVKTEAHNSQSTQTKYISSAHPTLEELTKYLSHLGAS